LTKVSAFPTGFLWGAATSAYQIEGSPLADGAGESIWCRFTREPGAIADGSNGDVACDHYRRFADDVDLMRELGLNAYRFSASWSRILPHGVGIVNEAGIDFYSRLVDTLLENRIQPMLTLYHWDLPAALQDRGGWANGGSPNWFAEYAQLMARRLGDRVPMWATINEPWVIVDGGYVQGQHAPGQRDWAEAALVAKNLLLAHAAAVSAFRTESRHQIGLVVNLVPVHAASDASKDQMAAIRLDAYLNRQFLDPVLKGQIPPELPDMFGNSWKPWSSEELRRVQAPIDFVGVNYYLRLVVQDDPAAGPARAQAVDRLDCPRTAMGWEIFPSGLCETLQWVRGRYGNLTQYVTENGAAFEDEVGINSAVEDTLRVQYFREHLLSARRAIENGVNLRGYFAWSLLDNFEWQFGYSKRFGIIAVDFSTQRRVSKSSARFFTHVIRTNGAFLQD
jgi:beta-glucosidase